MGRNKANLLLMWQKSGLVSLKQRSRKKRKWLMGRTREKVS